MVIDSLAARTVEFQPGERYAYNNNGYILPGLVIERTAGTPYADHLRTTILEPLGLRPSYPATRRPPISGRRGYVHATCGPISATVAPAHHATVTSAAGMLCSTAADLAQWERALATGKVINAESWRTMITPATLTSGRTSRYGLGIETHVLDGRAYVAHGGATPGFIGEAAYVPDAELSVVVLTNGIYAGSIVSQLVQAVAREALGMPQRTVVDLPLGASERARFAGTYNLGPTTLEVYEQGDHLRAQPPGQVATRLLYEGEGVFQAEHDPSLRLRFGMADGPAEELMIEMGGRAMPAAKRAR